MKEAESLESITKAQKVEKSDCENFSQITSRLDSRSNDNECNNTISASQYSTYPERKDTAKYEGLECFGCQEMKP